MYQILLVCNHGMSAIGDEKDCADITISGVLRKERATRFLSEFV